MFEVSTDNNLRLDARVREQTSRAFGRNERVVIVARDASSKVVKRALRLVTLLRDTEAYALRGQYWQGAIAMAKLLAIIFRCGDLGSVCIEARAARYHFDAATRDETHLYVCFSAPASNVEQ